MNGTSTAAILSLFPAPGVDQPGSGSGARGGIETQIAAAGFLPFLQQILQAGADGTPLPAAIPGFSAADGAAQPGGAGDSGAEAGEALGKSRGVPATLTTAGHTPPTGAPPAPGADLAQFLEGGAAAHTPPAPAIPSPAAPGVPGSTLPPVRAVAALAGDSPPPGPAPMELAASQLLPQRGGPDRAFSGPAFTADGTAASRPGLANPTAQAGPSTHGAGQVPVAAKPAQPFGLPEAAQTAPNQTADPPVLRSAGGGGKKAQAAAPTPSQQAQIPGFMLKARLGGDGAAGVGLPPQGPSAGGPAVDIVFGAGLSAPGNLMQAAAPGLALQHQGPAGSPGKPARPDVLARQALPRVADIGGAARTPPVGAAAPAQPASATPFQSEGLSARPESGGLAGSDAAAAPGDLRGSVQEAAPSPSPKPQGGADAAALAAGRQAAGSGAGDTGPDGAPLIRAAANPAPQGNGAAPAQMGLDSFHGPSTQLPAQGPAAPPAHTLGQGQGLAQAQAGGPQAPLTHTAGEPAAAQLAHGVRYHIARGETRFALKLDPPELGRVEVSMRIQADGRVEAVVRAEHGHTLDMLQRDARLLERSFHQLGLKPDGGIHFTSGQGGHGQGQQHFGDGQAGFEGHDQAQHGRPGPESQPGPHKAGEEDGEGRVRLIEEGRIGGDPPAGPAAKIGVDVHV